MIKKKKTKNIRETSFRCNQIVKKKILENLLQKQRFGQHAAEMHIIQYAKYIREAHFMHKISLKQSVNLNMNMYEEQTC